MVIEIKKMIYLSVGGVSISMGSNKHLEKEEINKNIKKNIP
jgi:hypothetical protein